MQDLEKKIRELASLIKEKRNTMVLTGAGMDTESNIPDFRSKDGWWKKIDPTTVATREAMRGNYDLFHEFYTYRIQSLRDKEPHEGHYILARLEEKGLINSIATQNVSGLHRKAGSKRVFELHGNINGIRCDVCGRDAEVEKFLTKSPCSYCGSKFLRPKVVLFGEFLPEEPWNKTMEFMRKSDIILVIGTSLKVYPVNEIPRIFEGYKVYINNEISTEYKGFDLTIEGKAKEVLTKLWEYLD